MSIRVAIVGPTGYTALYLIQLVLRHPSARITYLASRREEETSVTEIFPQLLGRLPDEIARCKPIDPKAIAAAADVVFLCLPHRTAMEYVGPLLDAGIRVIDLSADYRLKSAEVYNSVYGHEHSDTGHLAEAAYGLPELFPDEIPGARLVANPGCYPTAAALAIAPLLRRNLVEPDGIVINAASGVTGAGKSPAPHLHFPEHNESFMAYGVIGGHRHGIEIEQVLGNVASREVPVLFVPHLLPLDRGILETVYLDPVADDITEDELFECFEEAYDAEPFVRLRTDLPNVKHVRDTNFCDLTVRLVNREPRKIVVFSAIDNMIKGASGQALQNMNLMFDVEPTAGLL